MRTVFTPILRPALAVFLAASLALAGQMVVAHDVSAAGLCLNTSGTSDKVYVDKDSSELSNSNF